MFRPDWNALKAACGRKGYAFFDRGRLNLNLIGVRHSDYASNGFDDVLCCAWRDPENVKHVEHWPATTDPGLHWLQKEFNTNLEDLRREVQSRTFLTNPDGSFVKKDGQFVNRLVSPLPSNPQLTLIDSLVNEVNKFKGLIIKK